MKINVLVSESKLRVPPSEIKVTVSGSGTKPENAGKLTLSFGNRGRAISITRPAKASGEKPSATVSNLGRARRMPSVTEAFREMEDMLGIKIPASLTSAAKSFIGYKTSAADAKKIKSVMIKDVSAKRTADKRTAVNDAKLGNAKSTKFTQASLENLMTTTNMEELTTAQVKGIIRALKKLNAGKNPTQAEIDLLAKLRTLRGRNPEVLKAVKTTVRASVKANQSSKKAKAPTAPTKPEFITKTSKRAKKTDIV